MSKNVLRIDLFQKMLSFHAGTGFKLSFICNLQNHTVTQISSHYKKVISSPYETYKCIKKAPVYFDAISAMSCDKAAIIYETVLDKMYLIDEFYFSKPPKGSAYSSRTKINAIKIKMKDHQIGWINYNGYNFNKYFFYVPAGG